jgi:hypothetical protein
MKFNGKTMSAMMQVNYADTVVYTPQELTNAEQAQARKNIGAAVAAAQIVENAQGAVITAIGAAQMPLLGLKVYGKTLVEAGGFVFPRLSGVYIAEHCEGFEVLLQPRNVTAKTGDSVQFSVLVSGAGEYSYQWQYKQNNGAWYNSSATFVGNTAPCMIVPVTAARDGFYYRCKITNESGTEIFSAAAQLTIDDTADAPIYSAYTYTGTGSPQLYVDGIPLAMNGIPVESGGNYTDENGQQWLTDEIDFAAGKHTQRLGYIGFYTGDFSDMTGAYKQADTGELLYELEHPAYTTISEELAAFYALIASQSMTIFNDAEMGMQLQYVVDTKLYIDRKFEELQNAILALGANV